MRVTSKAPCRVDLAGATLDIWPLYLFHDDAVTVNFAVSHYTSCEIETRADARIVLTLADPTTIRRDGPSRVVVCNMEARTIAG